MALYYDLKVYKDVHNLILLLFHGVRTFPREHKYTIGQDMKRDGIVLVRSLYRANKAKSKKQYLDEFFDDFEVLKFEIRICHELRLLTGSKYAEIAALLEEIGKQVTGWRKSS